jgi:hypothetical protein
MDRYSYKLNHDLIKLINGCYTQMRVPNRIRNLINTINTINGIYNNEKNRGMRNSVNSGSSHYT